MAESMMAALGQPEHHQILRFGDVIILQEALSSNRGSFRGYVFSEISSSEYVAVASASPMETVGGFPITDWTMAAFKVVAPNKSVQQERYAEIKRHSRNYTAKHLQDAKRDAEVERKNNERLQEDLKGSVVVYDSVIQLLHMHSDKFLGVNTVQTSWTEESNMRISLFDHDSEKCSFKILPRYKLKSLEDQVMMGDAIMLASEKIKGLFLHTSNQKFEKWISVYKNLTCFEMNASAKNVSVFTILPHCSAVSDDRRLVKGGSIFQLYHHESQRYIVAEGSFANEPDECVTKQVHLRERKSKHGKLKDSSTSSITYWQIESDKDPTSGEVISWKDRCRIKHLPTKMYLAVVHEDNSSRVLVKLKHKEPDPNKSDVDIVFRLHSVTKDIAGIQFKSSAMIYHPYTKCWLGCVWGYSSRGDDELDAQELCIKSNAFTIEQLDAKLVNKFNHAAGFVPVIKSYLFSKLTSPNDISTRDTMFCKALKEMSIWVLNAHPTMKHHQKLLRNLMIPDMIVKVLQVYDPSSSVHERYADVFRTCYEVLEVYLKGKSSKNVHYLAMREDYMACFRNHAIDSKLYLHAGRTLLELIRDNEVILLSHNTKEIGGIIQSLVDSKYSFSFFYLSTLSVCDGRPLPRNQDIVTEMLVKQHGQELFYRYKVHETSDIHPSDKGPLRELQFSTSEHPRWRFLSDIFAASNNELKDNSAYWYLIGQLEVFSKICQENDAAIKVLDGEYITLEMAVCGLQDDKLHPMIRYMYAQIIIVMYVEKKRTVLEDRFPLFIYKDITKETSTKKQNISEVENVQFVLLKKWMLTYLSEHESIVTSDTDMNILTRGVLELLHLLIKHGYYAGINDVNVLMKPLLKLLDGKTDKPSNIETSFETDQKRFENNNENKFLFAVKVRALRIVDLLFSYQFHLRLQQFVCDYKQLRGAIDPNQKLEEQDEDLTLYKNLQDAGSTRPVKKAASKFALHEKQNVKAGFQLLVSKLGVNRDDMPGPPTALRLLWKCRASELQIHEHVWLMKLAVDRLEQILFYCCLDCDSQELSEILIDLSQYQNEELLCESLHLLGRIYSVEEELFENASQAQLLITSKSEKVFHMITTQLHPTLHHLTAVGAHDHEEQHQQLLSVLDQLISLCHMDGDQSEPDEQNQRILYNTGMFGNILSLLLATNATVSETDVFDNQQKKATISKCLQFLRLLARQNTKIREKLFKYVDSLLNVTIAIPEMASLLTEVLTEGHELCLKIKETQIEQLFKSIKVFYIDRDICPCSEVFELLQAMVKVKELNLPLKRNKDYMIKHFIQYYRSFPGHLLGLEEDNVSNRKNALANDELQALMMLSIFDLLATLCEKDNLFMESTCQSVISISELLEMLSSDELQPLWKKPYACFLLWVYMNSGVEKTKSGSIILYHDGKMWSYLEQISDVLNGTVRALRCLKDDNEKRVVQQSLTSEFVKLSSSKDHLGSRITAKTTAVDIPHVTNKNGEIIPGLLVYIMEGVLPLLEVFYTDYFKPAESFASDSHDPMKEIRVTAAMASSLLNFADTIKTFLSSQTQWELLYTTTVTVLQHRDCNGFTLDIDPQVRERFDETRNKKVNCGVIIQLSAIEEQERALNRQFHTFVRNYELSYWGPNTAEYQIGSQFSTPYSDFEDDHLEKKGDEWLPLGKSFQRHVDLYITFDGANVSVKPCTKRIIDFLVLSYKQSPTLNEKARRRLENDNIRYLQLLRAIIHNQVMLVDPRLREEGENPVLYRQLCKPVEIVQCEIQSYDNAVKRIAKLLAHRSDNVFIEVLALLCMMLYNGNRDVREGFTYLMASREEEILSSMQERLQQATMNNHERRKLLFDLQTQSDSHRSLREYHDNHPAARDTSGQETEMISMQHDSGKVTGTARRKLVQAYEMTILSKMESASSPTSHDVTDSPTEMRIRQYTDIGDKADLLKFKDHSHIKLTLHLLGLLCDDQYSPMQDYLQQQPLSLKNINMVTETCDFLSTFIDDVSKDNIKLIIQVLQTLIEMSGGNFKNQKVLLDHHVVDTINHFLRIMDIETHGFKELCKLKEKAVELLEIICEETHSETDKLVQSLCRNIDIDALYDTLVWFYQCSQSAKDKNEQEEAEKVAFSTYHVLVHMADFEGIVLDDNAGITLVGSNSGVNSKDLKRSTEFVKAWKHYKRQSRSIEVFYKNDDEDKKVLATVHFRYFPTDELPENIIDKVKFKVSRESPEDKVRDFLKWMKSVEKEISHLSALRRHWFAKIFVDGLEFKNYLLILWTLVMNIMLVIAWNDVELKSGYTYNTPERGLSDNERMLNNYCVETSCYNNLISNTTFTPSDCNQSLCTVAKILTPTIPEDRDHWFFDHALYVGGAIHFLMSLSMLISYTLINASNFVLPDIAAYEDKIQKVTLVRKLWPKKLFAKFKREPTYSDEPLFGWRPLYHILFVACSLLSLPFYGYFYCFCLLHIVIVNDLLNRVLRSVTKNGYSLIWVGALGLVVIYIYSVAAFALLPNEFNDPDPEGEDNVLFCHTLLECFISVLEYGLLDTLGSAVDLPMKFQSAALRVILLDLTFFIIVTTIGLNVVFGIIVDTFSELRDEKWKIEEDKQGYCFICSTPSYEFERKTKITFAHHIKHDHCMWNYIYYYLHLKRIDISDHNAIEKYVYNLIKEDNTDFFPLFAAKRLEKFATDETLDKLDKLSADVHKVMECLKQQEQATALHKKEMEEQWWDEEFVPKDEH